MTRRPGDDARSARLYRVLLHALPARSRAEAGDELVAVFRVRLARARSRGRSSVLAHWVAALMDLATTAALERLGRRTPVATARRAETGGENVSSKIIADVIRGLASIRRGPAAPALAIGTLALGLAASIVTFVVVRDVLVRPLPFRESDRLVRLIEIDERGNGWLPAFPSCVDWRRTTTELFDGVGCMDPDQVKPVIVGATATTAIVMRASVGLLETFGAQPVSGRLFAADENRLGGPPAAIVSRRFWRTTLGSAPLARLTITIGDTVAPIVGVLPDDFAVPGNVRAWVQPDVWMPLERDPQGGRGSHGFTAVARLRSGVSLDQAAAGMKVIAAAIKKAHGEPTQADSVGVSSLKQIVTRNARAPLTVVAWTAIGVLVVACLNFAATILARGLTRQGEFRLRLALGASRADLVRLVLAEGVALAVPALGLGLAIASAAIAWLRTAAGQALPRMSTVHLDRSAAVFACGAALTCAIAAAVLPAVALSGRFIATGLSLRGGSRGSQISQLLWNAFVAAEVALTLVLLSESGLLLRSFAAAIDVDLGYQTDRVVAMTLALPEVKYQERSERLAFYQRVVERVRELPDVEAAGLTSLLPQYTKGMTAGTSVPGRPADGTIHMAAFRIVDAGYFDAIGIPIRAKEAGLGPRRAFIDDGLRRALWPSTSPIGDRIASGFSSTPFEVAGIVGGVRQWDEGDPPGAVYVSLGDFDGVPFSMSLVVRCAGHMDRAATAIRDVVSGLDPQVPANPEPLAMLTAESLLSRRVLLAASLTVALIALMLSTIGTYALVTFSVRRRLRDVAIRLALGATPSRLWRAFAAAGVWPAFVGLAIGAVAARPAAALVATQLFHVEPGDPIVIVVAGGVLAAAAVLAAMAPARRASTTDPSVLLRGD